MTIRDERIDELLAGQGPTAAMRPDGLLGELEKALLNRLIAAGFDHHLIAGSASNEGRNHRNGATRNRVPAGDGHVEVTAPRPSVRPCGFRADALRAISRHPPRNVPPGPRSHLGATQ